MHKLRRRHLPVVDRLVKLRELRRWPVFNFNGSDKLVQLRELRCWFICRVVVIKLRAVLVWNIPDIHGSKLVH